MSRWFGSMIAFMKNKTFLNFLGVTFSILFTISIALGAQIYYKIKVIESQIVAQYIYTNVLEG